MALSLSDSHIIAITYYPNVRCRNVIGARQFGHSLTRSAHCSHVILWPHGTRVTFGDRSMHITHVSSSALRRPPRAASSRRTTSRCTRSDAASSVCFIVARSRCMVSRSDWASAEGSRFASITRACSSGSGGSEAASSCSRSCAGVRGATSMAANARRHPEARSISRSFSASAAAYCAGSASGEKLHLMPDASSAIHRRSSATKRSAIAAGSRDGIETPRWNDTRDAPKCDAPAAGSSPNSHSMRHWAIQLPQTNLRNAWISLS